MSSWFKLYREIFDSDIWYDVTTFRLFLLLIGRAAHRDNVTVAGVKLKRGQYLRSYRMLAKDLAYKQGKGTKEYSLRTIKRSIDKLISANRVNVTETEQGTLFTIVNYDKYQTLLNGEQNTGNVSNSKGETFGKRSVNNNKNEKNAREQEYIKDYTAKIKDLLLVFSKNINNFIDLNKRYWDVIRETRKTGKVADSVIFNNMKKWEKYDPVVVEYALKTHIAMHAGKKEEYTIGIMRNTSPEEAFERLNYKGPVFKAIPGGKQLEINQAGVKRDKQSSYSQDYSKYDFSKQNDL